MSRAGADPRVIPLAERFVDQLGYPRVIAAFDSPAMCARLIERELQAWPLVSGITARQLCRRGADPEGVSINER